MPEPITLKKILAKVIAIEYAKYIANGGSNINVANTNNIDRETLSVLVARCSLKESLRGQSEYFKLTNAMVEEMQEYLIDDGEYDEDDMVWSDDEEIFSFYSERFIRNCSSEQIVELYKLGN